MRALAKLGNQAYKIVGDELRISIKPRQYFYVKLHKRDKQFLSDPTLKLGSVTITTSVVSPVFKRTADVIKPRGYMAYDVNESSLYEASSENGKLSVESYDLSAIREIRHKYFERIRKA